MLLWQLCKYWLAYYRDLGPQTPCRLTYHQPVKHLPRVTSDLHYATHVTKGCLFWGFTIRLFNIRLPSTAVSE